jgi:hypothetical protein
MKTALIAIAAAATLAGCDTPEAKNEVAAASPLGKESKAPQTTYEFNGIVGGCKLFYVRPAFGNSFQFASCSNATTAWSESCGKACTRNVTVHTE